ncbi:uncharacterized protein KIAA1522-like [Lolium rigidum]|uniref:uncharacterized protein KIAA1522-like n=1 Tax=Lolium rigidum TaxID=89674 RepID=UPI001F5DA9BE|nr:uncharacterized protein KIAA1522-like [Lolium rigidum]
MTAAVAVSAPDPFSFHPSIAPLPPPPADAEGSDFEFRIPAAAAVLSAADELFSGGKLVPLLPPPPAPLPSLSCSPPPCQEEEPLPEPASPRAPRCAGRRWRDLLLLVTKKPKPAGEGACRTEASLGRRPLLSRDSSSSSSASSCDSGGRTARRPPPPSRSPLRTRSAPVASLLHLISSKHPGDCRNGAPPRRQPLLTRVSSSSSASSSDSGRTSRAPWHPRAPARHRPAVAAESPRVSASGRVVFRGLERCSSTPAGAGIGGGARRPRPRGMERSYSTNVRVDPVINVFGFGHLFFPSSPAKEKKTDVAGRRNRPEKLAIVLRDPQD